MSEIYEIQTAVDFAQPLIKTVKKLWEARVKEYVRTRGDRGTGVVGAGISITMLPKRCRVPRKVMIIPCDFGTQGSLTWEHDVQEMVRLLKPMLPTAAYSPGRMD